MECSSFRLPESYELSNIAFHCLRTSEARLAPKKATVLANLASARWVGVSLQWACLDSQDFGAPQYRKRSSLSDILEQEVPSKYFLSRRSAEFLQRCLEANQRGVQGLRGCVFQQSMPDMEPWETLVSRSSMAFMMSYQFLTLNSKGSAYAVFRYSGWKLRLLSSCYLLSVRHFVYPGRDIFKVNAYAAIKEMQFLFEKSERLFGQSTKEDTINNPFNACLLKSRERMPDQKTAG